MRRAEEKPETRDMGGIHVSWWPILVDREVVKAYNYGTSGRNTGGVRC